MNSMNSTASYGDEMTGSPSPYYANKAYLLDVIMKKLNISDEDLNKDTSWVRTYQFIIYKLYKCL